MRRRFAESRPALERGTPRPRNTKDRPVGGLHVPADRGKKINRSATLILPDNPPSRQVENADFRQRRSYVACALPLCGGLSSPKGKSCPQSNRRGVNRYALARPPVYFSTVTAADPAPVAGGSTAVEGVVQPLPAGRGCQPLPAAARGVRPPGHCADAGA